MSGYDASVLKAAERVHKVNQAPRGKEAKAKFDRWKNEAEQQQQQQQQPMMMMMMMMGGRGSGVPGAGRGGASSRGGNNFGAAPRKH